MQSLSIIHTLVIHRGGLVIGYATCSCGQGATYSLGHRDYPLRLDYRDGQHLNDGSQLLQLSQEVKVYQQPISMHDLDDRRKANVHSIEG
jgi:hypothetical protein